MFSKYFVGALASVLVFTTSIHAQKKPLAKTQVATVVEENLVPSHFNNLLWRNIGPLRGGRSVTATGVVQNQLTYYMGTTGGGVWKTEDAGQSWNNISDGFFKTGSVGAVAVAESDQNVVYVGMGEHAPRGVMSSYGDGVYKSTDAGKTWKHMGLELTRQISWIRIDPTNPDIVYLAAQGATHGPSADRGVYKSIDGGANWTKVLFVDNNTGCADLAMDMNNPRILYAAMWEYQRLPWEIKSGGPGSGLYKSTDAGLTWNKIQNGLPTALGKMSVSVSRANSEKVYALVESDTEKELGGLFVSNDAGKNWNRISKDHRLTQRAWYYIEVFADPSNENVVYVLNSPGLRSTDGGKTWEYMGGTHGDYHQLWIHPKNSSNMIVANDGGAAVTFNTGKVWSTQANQPTSQIYRVNADHLFPYNLYGGQQDNSSIKMASRVTNGYRISDKDWTSTAGGESAFVAFDPNNPTYSMGGSYQGTIEAYNNVTKEGVNIMEHPVQYQALQPKDMKYRFNWNAPIVYDPLEPGAYYHAGNILFKTTDLGKTWKAVSPDLTKHDTAKMRISGVPYTNEGAGGENYCTISYVALSENEKGVIYTGSDDGLVYLTKDGGAHWTNITPKNLDESLINAIEVSTVNKGTAYIAVNKYKFNNFTPNIYVTNDYGASWKEISTGIPYGAFVKVVREDPTNTNILYAGTETGFYISYDAGAHWKQLQLNLPVVPITDLKVHENHLLASTQGRAFWILDDLAPIRNYNSDTTKTHLFTVSDVYRISGGSVLDRSGLLDKNGKPISTLGANQASGAVLYYNVHTADSTTAKAKITFSDNKGKVIRTFYAKPPSNTTSNNKNENDPTIDVKSGLNRFVWDLREESIASIPGVFIEGSYDGARVVPGTYKAALHVGSSVFEKSFNVLADPRINASATDYQNQANLLQQIATDVNDIHVAVVRMRNIQKQMTVMLERIENKDAFKGIIALSDSITDKINAWEEKLIQTKSESNDDVINFVNKLSANYIFLRGELDTNTPHVTAGHLSRFKELNDEWNIYKAQYSSFIEQDIKRLNEKCKALQLSHISLID
jgi:photosystem II stability/assembly factor-like uncharacterized protein